MTRRAVVLALVAFAVASCTASADETGSATVVLFDVSNSTRAESVRARYDETFAMVLEHLRDDGGVLGADIVDANPLVHGGLPINEMFEPCTIMDNSLDCREAQRAAQAAAAERRALRDSTEAELRAIRAHRERLFFAYCSANVRAREGHVTPTCFETAPPLELPAGFADPVARVA